MKRLTLFSLCLSASALSALPVGNPIDSTLLRQGLFSGMPCCEPTWYECVHFKAGFYGDYVFNRHLELDSGDFHKNADECGICTNSALLAVNFCDYADLFATLGTTNLTLRSNASLFTTDIEARGLIAQIKTSTDFSWSVGFRSFLFCWDCTSLGIEGQYFSTTPDLFRVTNADSFAVYPANTHLHYQEWQVGLGLTQSIQDCVYPYIAVKYARANLNLQDAEPYGIGNGPLTHTPYVLTQLKSAKNIGYAVGITLIYADVISITAEGRFADEKAFHINGVLEF